MAKQVGPFWLQTTWDDLTFYKMEGKYYARKKSRLTRDKVLHHPAFSATRCSANRLALASKIASAVYKALPSNWRQFWMYRAFTGEAFTALKQGVDTQQVYHQLWSTYAACWTPSDKPAVNTVLQQPAANRQKKNKTRLRHRSENPYHRRYQRLLGPNHWKSTYDNTPALEAQARKEEARKKNREWFDISCLRRAQRVRDKQRPPITRWNKAQQRYRRKHQYSLTVSSINNIPSAMT